MITIRCAGCLRTVEVDLAFAKQQLHWNRQFGFGKHVRDPRAFAVRWMVTLYQWIYVGDAIEESRVTMRCPKCRAGDRIWLLDAEVEQLDADPESEVG